jgi:hypothetical protein
VTTRWRTRWSRGAARLASMIERTRRVGGRRGSGEIPPTYSHLCMWSVGVWGRGDLEGGSGAAVLRLVLHPRRHQLSPPPAELSPPEPLVTRAYADYAAAASTKELVAPGQREGTSKEHRAKPPWLAYKANKDQLCGRPRNRPRNRPGRRSAAGRPRRASAAASAPIAAWAVSGTPARARPCGRRPSS